jgi:phospholipase C
VGGTLIDHVVIVLQENHTFDNYFGTYPGADGLTGKTICLPNAPGSSQRTSPFHSPTRTPADMDHGPTAARADFDGGAMAGFVYTEATPATMSYFDSSDLPRYWAIAKQYVLCDQYFTSVMSESAPNHLFLVAGTAGGLKDDRVPNRLPFPPIFQQLDALGVSWGVYGFSRWFESFDYVQRTPSAKAKFAPARRFSADVAGGSLPSVAWVIGAPGGSEHPPQDVQVGQNSVVDDILNPLGRSAYWPRLAAFVTWDDYGGWYDHVAPLQVDADGYGFRVPCLIVSPYARSGFIDHALNDHTSLLRFVEKRFGATPLSKRDAAANDLSEAFDFSQAARAYSPF